MIARIAFEYKTDAAYPFSFLRTTNKTDGCDSLDLQAALLDGVLESPLDEELAPFELEQSIEGDEKAESTLTQRELERERDLVQFYYDNHKHWFALECARELFLNRLLYEQHGTDVDWLDVEVRTDVARQLGKYVRIQRADGAPSPPAALRLWDTFSQYRNAHAHAGFKKMPAPSHSDVKAQKTHPVTLFLLDVHRRGLGTPGQYRDPVCGMRTDGTDDDGPSASHEGTAYYFCSTTCQRTFEENPTEFADQSPQVTSHDHDH